MIREPARPSMERGAARASAGNARLRVASGARGANVATLAAASGLCPCQQRDLIMHRAVHHHDPIPPRPPLPASSPPR
eukprot:351645-Chlamydomonas_euryale.AAC.10